MIKTLYSDKGFTLLELLISVALLAVILGAIYGTFFLSHKAVNGVDESLLKLRESRTVLSTIAREAESALYRAGNRYSRMKMEDRDYYGKQASSITFTAFSPLTPGLSLISYYVEEKDGTLTLYKKMDNPYLSGSGTSAAELIEGIESFSLEARNGDKWVKTWDASEAGGIPAELRITVTVAIKDRPVTLFETVRPKVDRAL